MTTRPDWTFVLCDGLEKVFADERPRGLDESIPSTVFLGEVASFQIAFLPPSVDQLDEMGSLTFEVTRGGEHTRISSVELVPCDLVTYDNPDAGYLRTTPGLYPDLLRPIPHGTVAPVVAAQWRAVWLDFVIVDAALAGEHIIEVRASSTRSKGVVFEGRFVVHVLGQSLPELGIVNTSWFHFDSLANYYGVEVFSEDHWYAIEMFAKKAAEAGINSLLTPVWTPPIDTAVGGLRTPTQLVDIVQEAEDEYSFNFEKLERWLGICESYGIANLEVSHLFTQWGALKTPAIYVAVDGQTQRKFGWDVEATDPRYRTLLVQLLPALRELLERRWSLDRVVFHVSDEPTEATLESYKAARAVVADLLEGCTVADALSDFEFYSSGLVDLPIVATDHIEPFLTNRVDNYWAYYCVAQSRGVANRFIGMPSTRNRVIGWQLWAFAARGFLQWGYNFYNSELSVRSINPFSDTTVGGVFPAGDAFIVYPGPNGEPLESIRFRVFAMAMADLRALRAAESRVGRERVLRLIDPDGTFAYDNFSYDPDHYRRVREAITQLAVG